MQKSGRDWMKVWPGGGESLYSFLPPARDATLWKWESLALNPNSIPQFKSRVTLDKWNFSKT